MSERQPPADFAAQAFRDYSDLKNNYITFLKDQIRDSFAVLGIYNSSDKDINTIVQNLYFNDNRRDDVEGLIARVLNPKARGSAAIEASTALRELIEAECKKFRKTE